MGKRKYSVEYTTENPAYTEGRVMWKVVALIAIVAVVLYAIF